MLQKLLRFFAGFVVFEIIGNFPERFINLCMHRGVRLFEIEPKSEGFFAAMPLRDYMGIRPLARRGRVRLRHVKRVGLPFIMQRYKSRCGLAVGALLFIVISLVMQSFLWTVELKGVETISISELEAVLLEENFRPGTFKNSVDPVTVERRLMQEFPEIGWISVNEIGTKAEIEIKEKAQKPEIFDYRVPHNVVAGCDGLIKSIVTKQGSAAVKSGSAVIEGQLLVSSAMVNALDEIDYVHAEAEVMATTSHKLHFEIPKEIEYKKASKSVYRRSVKFCFLTFPVSFQSVSSEHTEENITEMIFLDDTQVPVGLKSTKIIPYENNTSTVTKEKAKEIFQAEDALNRLFALQNSEEIAGSSLISETDKGFSLNVTYTCLEDIAREEEFIVN